MGDFLKVFEEVEKQGATGSLSQTVVNPETAVASQLKKPPVIESNRSRGRRTFFEVFEEVLGEEETQSRLQRQAEAERIADEAAAAKGKENIAKRSEFVRGLLRGIDQTQATFYGGLGILSSAMGDDKASDMRFQQYREQMRQASENPATVDEFFSTDPKKGAFGSVGNLGTYVAGTMGSLLPTIAESAVAGLAGAAIGGAIVPAPDPTDVVAVPVGFIGGVLGRGAMKKAIAETAERYVARGVAAEAAQQMGERAVKNALAKRIGATIGTSQITALQEGGGMYAEGRAAGYDNPWSAILLGQVSGASEGVLGNVPFALRTFIGKTAVREAAQKFGAKEAAGLLWDAVKNAGEEAVQESFQEFLGDVNSRINDPNQKIFTKENFKQWAESGAAGALAGGILGGGGVATQAALDARRRQLEELRAKGFISKEEAKDNGIEGSTRREIMGNAEQELADLNDVDVLAKQESDRNFATQQQQQAQAPQPQGGVQPEQFAEVPIPEDGGMTDEEYAAFRQAQMGAQGGSVSTPPPTSTPTVPPVAPQPTVQPPQVQPQQPAAVQPSQAPGTTEPTDISKAIDALGKGAVDGLYIKIWNDVQSGSLQKMDKPPLFEQLVLRGYNGGVVRSLEDVRSIQDGMTGDFETDKVVGVNNLNKLASKYQGQQPAAVQPPVPPAVEPPQAPPVAQQPQPLTDKEFAEQKAAEQGPVAPQVPESQPPATAPLTDREFAEQKAAEQGLVTPKVPVIKQKLKNAIRFAPDTAIPDGVPFVKGKHPAFGDYIEVSTANVNRIPGYSPDLPLQGDRPPKVESNPSTKKGKKPQAQPESKPTEPPLPPGMERVEDWKKAVDESIESDPMRASSIMRRVAQRTSSDAQAQEILDRLPDGFADRSNVGWDIVSNRKLSESIRRKAAEWYKTHGTGGNPDAVIDKNPSAKPTDQPAPSAMEFNVGQGARPIPGMEGDEANYTVLKRKPDVIPDTVKVVISGRPGGKGWISVDGTGMTGIEAYDRAMRKYESKRPGPSRDKTRKEAIRKAIEEQGGFDANSSDDMEAIRNKLYDGADTPTGTEIQAVMDDMRVEAGRKLESELADGKPKPPAGYKPLEEFTPMVTQTLSPDLELEENRNGIKELGLKKGEPVGYRVYPKRGSIKGGYWQYGKVRYEPSGSHASIELEDGTVESVGGSRLIRLEPTTETSPDLSGEEKTAPPKIGRKPTDATPAPAEPQAEQPEQSEGVDAALKALDAMLASEKPKEPPKPRSVRKEPEKTKQGQYVLPLMPGMAAEIDRQDFVRRYRDRALEPLWGWSSKEEDAEGIQATIDTLAPIYSEIFNDIYAGKRETIDDVYDSEPYERILKLDDDAIAVGDALVINRLDEQIKAALQDYPKKEAKRPPRKSEQTLKEAKSDMQAAHDAAQALMDKIRGKLMSGVDPEISAEVVRVAYLYTKAGVKTFKGYVEAILENFGDTFAREFAPYMQDGWTALNIRGLVSDPTGKVDDYLAKETTKDYGTPEKPNRIALGRHFYEKLKGGASYPRITDARKEASDLLGGSPKDGSSAIKDIDESVEIGVVLAARDIAQSGESDEDIYDQLVDLYGRQPNLANRTSTSMKEQAYSTPAPLAFIANRRAGVTTSDIVYDSSAGNGMLLIAGGKRYANELNEDRAESLRSQGVDTHQGDATSYSIDKPIDALVINPPFGTIEDAAGKTISWNIEGVRTDKIDHAISMRSLADIPENGKAVIVIAAKGFEKSEPKSDSARGAAYLAEKRFYDHVYDNYNVTDHFTVHGDLYRKQGASFPVDVIVISGKGKSQRPKPYNIVGKGIPEVIRTWEELKDAKLRPVSSVSSTSVSGGEGTDSGSVVAGDATATTKDAEGLPAGTPGKRMGTKDGGKPKPQKLGVADGQPGAPDKADGKNAVGGVTPKTERNGAGGGLGDAGRPSGSDRRDNLKPDESAETDFQVSYSPGSKNKSVDTLIPRNHQAAVEKSLDAISEVYGDIDEFVARELGYEMDEFESVFSAEQVDALAMAIARHKDGGAFIIGDQTGVGKGRAAAAMMVYANRNGMVPVFITEKPTLYADMIRDLIDIGRSTDDAPFNLLMTNALSGKNAIPLPDGRVLKQSPDAAKDNLSGAVASVLNGDTLSVEGKPIGRGKKKTAGDRVVYNAVFTTYSQLQPVKQMAPERARLLKSISSKSFFILDESHNAGGGSDSDPNANQERRSSGQDATITRAEIVRDLISEAAGLYFSSATYAKRPQTMGLYAKTGMTAATNGDPNALSVAIATGGVPLQQVVSEQLVESGMYLRRERSFDGVEFNPKTVDVDLGNLDNISSIFSAINFFDGFAQEAIQDLADEITSSGGTIAETEATGEAGLESTSFSSILHNLVDQMLLAVKADSVANEAIESIKGGESPVIYVDSTLEAALKRHVEETGALQGEEIDFSYKDLVRRYLERSREYTTRTDADDPDSVVRIRLTDQQLGEAGVLAYERAMEMIESFSGDMPASPIDWIRKRITDAGYSVGEITGRQVVLEYQDDGTVRLGKRSEEEEGSGGRTTTVSRFNSGELDSVLINQSGSTGISMHASERFKNQKPRHMVIGQPARNIDTFMQSLGRVHRTGQVALPRFTLLMTNAPAEIRPASVLMKKLASLNANVTASAKGSVSFDAPDVINIVGDQVVAEYLADNLELDRHLGELVQLRRDGTPKRNQGIAKKASGRMALRPVAEQKDFWDSVIATYDELISELNRVGKNPLLASTLDLNAKTIEAVTIFDGDEGSANLFMHPASIETIVANKPGKPMTSEEVQGAVKEFYGEPATDAVVSKWLKDIESEIRTAAEEYLNDVVGRGLSGEELQIARTRFQVTGNTQFENLMRRLRSFAPGKSISVYERSSDGAMLEVIPGFVTKVKRLKGGNPLAASKWMVDVAIASPDRIAKTALSRTGQQEVEGGPAGGTYKEFMPNNELFGAARLRDFDEADASTTEVRYVGVGNILAAYAQLGGSGGQVTFFTDTEGKIRRGVLMPRSFRIDRWEEARPVVLDNVDQAHEFLSSGGQLTTPDRVLSLMLVRGELIARAPKAKSKSGKYTINAGILEAASPQEFGSIGNRMEMAIEGKEKQKQVLTAIMQVASLQAVGQDKPLARNIKAAAQVKSQSDLDNGLRNPPPLLMQTEPDIYAGFRSQAMKLGLAAEKAGITAFEDFVAHSVETIGTDETYKLGAYLRRVGEIVGMTGIRPVKDILGVPMTPAEYVQLGKQAFAGSPQVTPEQVEAGIEAAMLTGLPQMAAGFAPAGSPVPGQGLMQGDFDQPADYEFTESDYRPAVVSYARDKWGGEVAANGKPTWQNFVRWFDDSEVVDKDGNPLVVYHGGARTIDDNIIRTPFFYMTENRDEAQHRSPGATLHEFYVKMSKPHRVDEHLDNFMDFREYAKGLKEDGDVEFAESLLESTGEALTLVEALKSAGNDGIIMLGEVDEDYDNFIAFDPTQIKSATGNAGTFDPRNPNMLMQGATQTDTPAFKKWFGDSKVVDKDGEPLRLLHGTTSSFNVFSGRSFAAFGTEDVELAEGYAGEGEGAKVFPVYFKAEKPAYLEIDLNDTIVPEEDLEEQQKPSDWDEEEEGEWSPSVASIEGKTTQYELAEYFDLSESEFSSLYREALNENKGWFGYPQVWRVVNSNAFKSFLVEKGYDSFTAKEGGVDVWAVVDPTQIKSATGNRGTFDPNNPNMLMQQEGQDDAAYLDAVERGDMEAAQKMVDERLARVGAYWHGTPSGDLRGGVTGLHVGTKQAATEALEARIGIPADGKGWDGTREYAKTLLAGKDLINSGQFGKYRLSGYNMNAPDENYYPTKMPTVGSSVPVDPSWKPWVRPVLIVGEMTNTPRSPISDAAANRRIKRKRGAFYTNEGEDAGSVSAVLPSGDSVRIKLADPVTYNDSGSVIPLSQRFDNQQPDIRFQRQSQGGNVKGWTKFISGTRALIGATNKADISTVIHEYAHVIRRFLLDRDVPQDQRIDITDEEIAMLEEKCGVKDGNWDVPAEEKFAKMWEQYFFEGNSPNTLLDSLFAKISRWMQQVYQTATSITGGTLDPEVRKLFDKMVQRQLPADQRTDAKSRDGGAPPVPTDRQATQQADDDNLTSVANAYALETRMILGLPGFADVTKETFQEWIDQALQILRKDPTYGNRLVKELAQSNRNIDKIETAVLELHLRSLKNLSDAAADRLFAAVDAKDDVAAVQARRESDLLINEIEEVTDVTNRVGTEQGRSLAARKIVLRSDFTLAGLRRTARVANAGQPLNEEQSKQIEELAKQIATLEGDLAKETQKNDDLARKLAAKESIDDTQKQAGKPVRNTATNRAVKKVENFVNKFVNIFGKRDDTTTLQQTEDEQMAEDGEEVIKSFVEAGVYSFGEFMSKFKAVIKGDVPVAARAALRKAWEKLKAQGDIPAPEMSDERQTTELRRLAKMVERNLVEFGITDPEEVIDGVHEALQEVFEDVTQREAMDAMSGYGQYSTPSQEPVDKIIRDLNAQFQQMAKLDDMKQGIAPKKSGRGRDEPSPDLRELIREVNEMKRNSKYFVTDPEAQLKTIFRATRTALRNRIYDLNKAIKTKEPIPGRTPNTFEDEQAKEIESLRKQRDELMADYKATFPKPGLTFEQRAAIAERAVDREITKIEQQLASGNVAAKERAEPVSTPALKDKQNRLESLRAQREAVREMQMTETDREQRAERLERQAEKAYVANLLNRIADYEDRKAQGYFGPKPKKEPRALSPREIELSRQLVNLKDEFFRYAAEYRLKNMSKVERFWDRTKETMHLSRAIMTSFDLSAVFRQGGIASLAHPRLAAAASREMLSALRRGDAEFDTMDKISKDELYTLAMRAGLSITTDSGKITRQEEAYMGRWAKWGIGKKGTKINTASQVVLKPITASARAYTTFLNSMRFRVFKYMVSNLSAGGEVTIDEAKVIASYVNAATGRAELGKFNQAAANLNTVFFAPRYVASRFQYLAMPFYLLPSTKVSGRVKKMIAMEYARHAMGLTAFLGLSVALASLLTDDEEEKPTVEFDPRSSDFMKLKIGDTRIDPMAGLSQTVTLIGQMATGQKKGLRGDIKDLYGENRKFGDPDLWDVGTGFLRKKLAPIPGAIVDLRVGENVIGEKETVLSATTDLFVPLSFQEAGETMKARGLVGGAVVTALSLLGMGGGTYGPKTQYATADTAKREELFKKDLENVKWNDPDLAYKDFLTTAQLDKFNKQREGRKQSLVFSAAADPKRKDYNSDETFKKSVEERDKALEAVIKAGMGPKETQLLLIAHYKRNYGSAYEVRGGVYQMKESLANRLRTIRRKLNEKKTATK